MAQLPTEQQVLAKQCVAIADAAVVDAKSLEMLIELLPAANQDAAREALTAHTYALRELQFCARRLVKSADDQANVLERIYAISLYAVDQMRFLAAGMQVPANDDFGCLEELAQIQELIEPIFPGEPALGA